MKNKWVDAYLDCAERFAELSSARRLKCGAIVVKNNQIISIGYNGTPSGWDNNCENELPDGSLVSKECVIHAEENAIGKLAQSTESSNGAVMFITHNPCKQCAKLIHSAGIKKIYYRGEYRTENSGIPFLLDCGIECIKVV